MTFLNPGWLACNVARYIPVDRFLETDFKGGVCFKSKEVFRTLCIQTATRLPVGFGGVPFDPPFVSDQFGNELDQIAYANFHATAKIDRLVSIIGFRGQDDRAGAIFSIQKLSGGVSSSPAHDMILSPLLRFKRLLDEGGNDVR